MRSYDSMDSHEFMHSNGNYRVLAYMVQPFFDSEDGELMPDTPIMKFIPLENDSGVLAAMRHRKMAYNKEYWKRYKERRERRRNERN